jgi:hypothetical protein
MLLMTRENNDIYLSLYIGVCELLFYALFLSIKLVDIRRLVRPMIIVQQQQGTFIKLKRKAIISS